MRFHVAMHNIRQRPARDQTPRLFVERLCEVIRTRGHALECFPDVQLPPAAPGVVSLGYHSLGRRPLTWHMKKSYLAEYFYLDLDGYAGWSEMALSLERFQASDAEPTAEAWAFVDAFRADYLDAGRSKLPQPDRQYHHDGRPYVFLPLQLEDDRVMELARIGYADFARGVVAALAGSGYRVVIKRHPRCASPTTFRLVAELAAQPHVKVTATAVQGLIRQATAVVCINSGVGFEALFYGKPVFTAGAVDYAWVTRPLADLEDLHRLPDRLPGGAEPYLPEPDRVARFLAYFCRRYLIRYDDEAAMHRRVAAMVAVN